MKFQTAKLKEGIKPITSFPSLDKPKVTTETKDGIRLAYVAEVDRTDKLYEELKDIVKPTEQENTISKILDEPFAFVTGPAGSGKTFSIRKKALESPNTYELAATTGIAAINLGGYKTINSLLKYFDTQSLEERYIDQYLHFQLRLIREDYQNLGIEEVSMMDAKQLDLIYDAINEINQDKNPRKLGLHLIGDMLQLPPVSTKQKPADIITKANCWPEFKNNMVKLEKIWRQENPEFIQAINLVRSGNGANAVLLLKKCGVEFRDKIIDKFDGTTLISKNDGVDAYNSQRLNELTTPMIRVSPKRGGDQLSEWTKQIPNEMRFKVGAYVMLLSNKTPDFEYVNGDTANIISYNEKTDSFRVKLLRNGEEFNIGRITRFNLQKQEPTNGHFTNNFRPSIDIQSGKWIVGSISYHPLRLAWATTVHKSQGLSLDKVQIDISPYFFGFPGMAYTSISRCKTPNGLIIIGGENTLVKRITTNKELLDYV